MFDLKVIPFTIPAEQVEPPSAQSPKAHCYAIPRANGRGEPPGFWWSIIIPVCPHCGERHCHGSMYCGETDLVPFDRATRSGYQRAPHCNTEPFINKRSRDQWGEAYKAQKIVNSLSLYELIVDLVPPLKEWREIPEHLWIYAWMALPQNANAVALDSEVY